MKLNIARLRHSCALLTQPDGATYVVVVGGYSAPSSKVSGSEYMNVNLLDTFTLGPILPDGGITEGQLLPDPETGELLYVGGSDKDENKLGTIYKLVSISDQWELLSDIALKSARHLHVSFFVPCSKLPC